MKSKTKKIILFSSIAVFLCAITAIILVAINRKSSEENDSANKKYDENNIGEVYCASIDEKHIAVNDNGTSYIDNEILVVAKDGVSKSDIEELAKENDAQIVGYIEQTGDYQLQFSKAMSESEFDNVIGDLKKNDKIISADKNFVFTVSTQSVDYDVDPGKEWNNDLFANEISIGALYSILKSKNNKAWGVAAIRAPQAWTAMNLIKDQINPVNVGLIDSGFFMHDDLGFAEMFYENGKNRVDVKDEKHGTHVAGIMAAKGNNKEGICGVYPYADGKLYGASWAGADQYNKNKISVMKEKCCFSELIFRNVKVINCSYGFDLSTYYDNEASLSFLTNESKILADYLKRALKRGYDFVIVSAAGNESDDIVVKLKYQTDSNGNSSPIINNNTVEYDEKGCSTIVEKKNGKLYYIKSKNEIYEVVGIKDYDKQTFIANRDYRDGHLESKYASFLNAIPNEEEYENVNKRIVVVGSVFLKISNFSNAGERVDIFAPGERIYSTISNNEYDYLQGTSMAAPHVAGVCANVWSIDNSLSGEEVKKIVCNSWVDDKSVYKTPDTQQDRGVVDCLKAVNKAFEGVKNKNSTAANEVKNGAVLGWVYDKTANTALEGAKVVAKKDGKVLDDYTVKTDKYGHFELIIPEGTYTLCITNGEEYTPWEKSVTVKNGEVNYFNDGEGETIKLAKTVKKDSNKDKPLKNAITPKYLDEISIIESDQYNDNEGDSFVYPIGKHRFSRGKTDISGNEYEHGIEVWIARWNYTAEKSWAYSVFKLNKEYRNISGKCVLINSYNTNNFNTTLEFYGDGKLIKKYSLTPDSVPFDIDVDVNNIDELKIYAYDNIAVSGGTSFGLTDMKLDSTNDKGSDNKTKDVENLASKAASENGKKYWIVFHEGYRDGRLEMTSFNAENGFKVVWNKNLVCDRQTGQCAQFAFDTNKSAFVKIGDYNIITDYAIDVVYSNVDIYDTNGNIVFKATHKSNNKELDVKTATDEQLYKEILDQYKKDIADGFVFGIGNGSLTANEVGFAFYDLNNDGYKELMIIQGDGKEKSGTIFDLYSTVDSKPKRILGSTFVGSSISIAQDNSIVLYERFSMFSGWYNKYNSLKSLLSSKFPDKRVEPDEKVEYDDTIQTGSTTYTYSIGGNKKTISGSEFRSIVNKWTNNSKTFSIKLFSEYK